MAQTQPTDALSPKHAYRTLSSRYYWSPEIFEKEKTAILYRHWHYAGHISQFAAPGDYLTLRIGDEHLIVMRGDDGDLRGFFNVCRHRAHRLLENSGNVKAIVCPYHAWTYNRQGELRYARGTDAMPDFKLEKHCLSCFKVEVFCNFVFVNLDTNAISLAEQAGDLAEDLKLRVPFLDQLKPILTDTGRPTSIDANWKVVMDNFLECYHCPKGHPAFADMIDMDSFENETFGLWSRQSASIVNPNNSAYQFSKDAPLQDANFWFLWPTLAMGYLPGEKIFFASAILPNGIDKTYRYGHRYVVDGAPLPGNYNDYINTVIVPEDIALCESVQQGLMSQSYDDGPFVVDPDQLGISEHAVQQFHGLVRDALGNI